MWYLGYFSISFEKITFYTEILSRKVELWIFSTRFTPEKTPQNNFSSQNFSVENNYFYLHKYEINFWNQKQAEKEGQFFTK